MGNLCNSNQNIIVIEYSYLQEPSRTVSEQQETQIYKKAEIIKEYQNTSNIEGSQGSDQNFQRIGGRGRPPIVQQSNIITYDRIRNSLQSSTSTQSFECGINYDSYCHISDPCPRRADIKSLVVDRNINHSY